MSRIGLGIDIGGTATRWQLQNESGHCMAEGEAPGLHGVMVDAEQHRHTVDVMRHVLAQVLRHAHPTHVVAGITGYAGNPSKQQDDVFHQAITRALPQASCLLLSDVLLSYFCAFEPGQGYVVYAGTGSMSAYVDGDFVLHRAGGRGAIIDDAGGGYWMAKEALKHIWQAFDQDPEAHLQSPLAQAIFQTVGGNHWDHTRHYIYTRSRGDIGRLSMHLATHADTDPIAREVISHAGRELARLAKVQIARHGPRPVVVTGGAAHIHPLYFDAFVSALDGASQVRLIRLQAQHHAARLGAQATPSLWLGIQKASFNTR